LVSFFTSFITCLTTCPGFPGYCSEAFPGTECNVVCDVGRNNVPLCQADGTWTDIPRCIEHEPGVEDQIPGLCPAIPGYCAQGFINHRCVFDCRTGADIDSVCTPDGTWAPYPTCEGDLRDTQDGCDGCPGPRGGARNRTAEAAILSNTISDRRVPKIVDDDGGRKNIPSFAGNINIGVLKTEGSSGSQDRFGQGRPTPRAPPSTTPFSPTPPSSTPPSPTPPSSSTLKVVESLSLFERIKSRINRAKNQKKNDLKTMVTTKHAQTPIPKFRAPKQPSPQPFQQSAGSTNFGVFEHVNLNHFGKQQQQQARESQSSNPKQGNGFFWCLP